MTKNNRENLDPLAKVTQKNYALCVEAYRKSLSEISDDYSQLKALEKLFIYGFDQFSIDKKENSYSEYHALSKLYNRFNNFTSIRGYFKKLDFFKENQDFSKYALEYLDYMSKHEFYCLDNHIIGLKVWAMGLLALFNPAHQAIFLEKLLNQQYAVFQSSDSRIFCLFCEKMINQYGEDIFSLDARSLVNQLVENINEKRRSSESFAWKTHLDIDLPMNDWGVTIWIDLAENAGYAYLELQDDHQFNWEVSLSHKQFNHLYHERLAYHYLKNDFELPIFSDFGVLKFPVWLKILEKSGYCFDWESIKITGLRKKTEKQKVIKWLMEPFIQ
ncbi:hypothetical protein [Acinetobacter shaoyimingii]|uniref:Uncharacterized protein n=1 Tax=Acinetobacter shaoyimingii TaxID=2715164 RepID=A0A6G8RYP7_9GAMM|nr:hypothetical protein [Acinetobacter shaoyimingii]QIO07072.1 hypothetical protein G8E00_14570 [Acinetobacter shaoyimingii]